MKILLTGGAGYIGSTTANFFLDKGHEVFIIDNLSRGNILNIPEKAKFIKTSIQNKKKVSALLKRENFDILIHFAAYIDVEESMSNSKLYNNNNFLNTVKLIDNCIKNNLTNIIFSSTAAIYGNNKSGVVSENSRTKPVSPYAISKLKSENYIRSKKN